MAISEIDSLQDKKVHFIGVGGISMSALAAMHLKSGGEVTGSDIKAGERLEWIRELGGAVKCGHSPENIKDQDLVVVSSAIPEDNIELQKARKMNKKVISRAEFLAKLTADNSLIAVTGTHGKTTTTAMLTEIFLQAERDPSVMIGGELNGISGNHLQGRGDYFLIEADESDGSLINYNPWLGIITNMEEEHLDFYEDSSKLIKTMVEFSRRIRDDGHIILCSDDPVIKTSLLPVLREIEDLTIHSYGINSGDYQAERIEIDGFKSSYSFITPEGERYEIDVNSPGRHNVLNSLAAVISARIAGIGWQNIITALGEFSGVKRRFEEKGSVNDIRVIDDYAHHPSEILATYHTADKARNSRIVTVFQPHRFTRTAALWDQFADVLSRIDNLWLCDIYPANQEAIPGVNSRDLVRDIRQFSGSCNTGVKYAGDIQSAFKKLRNFVEPGDLVLTLGAGDVYKVGEWLLSSLRENDCE